MEIKHLLNSIPLINFKKKVETKFKLNIPDADNHLIHIKGGKALNNIKNILFNHWKNLPIPFDDLCEATESLNPKDTTLQMIMRGLGATLEE